MLAVAVAFLACLCVFSLVLNYAVIRRLREHTELLTKLSGRSAADDVMHAAGTPVPSVRTVAVDGAEVVVGEDEAATLVGFFTPHCPACTDRLPEFADRAARMPGGAANVVAVVIGDPDEIGALRQQLAPVARVVNEEDGGPLGRALGVQGYPAFALVDSSVIRASGFDLTGIPVPETA